MRAKKLCSLRVLIFAIMFSLLFSGNGAAEDKKVLMMATTTSTDNTGLLDYLALIFKKETGIELRWTATGTGKALKLGENCDVDVLFVHSPADEIKFIESGFGIERREVMANDFVLIGPATDPAGLRGKPIKEALRVLKAKQAKVVSRGDDSGTHQKEIKLWIAAGIPVPDEETWYVQTGQGMITTIHIAEEQNAYTLTDRGTYIKYENISKGKSLLTVLVEEDMELLNQYSVIAINPAHCSYVNQDLALQWIRWITSAKTQQVIKDFKILGKPLFIPNAKNQN